MKPINLFFILIGLVLVTCVYFVADHIINYETWGYNENFFIDDYHGYKVTCDINYFADPSNCMVVDEFGNKITNEILEELVVDDECYYLENNNILPCIVD